MCRLLEEIQTKGSNLGFDFFSVALRSESWTEKSDGRSFVLLPQQREGLEIHGLQGTEGVSVGPKQFLCSFILSAKATSNSGPFNMYYFVLIF